MWWCLVAPTLCVVKVTVLTHSWLPSIRYFRISHNAPYFPSSPRPRLKFCITFVFHFSWVLQPSQEKLKTMLMKNFGGQIRCIMGNVEVASWRWVEMTVHAIAKQLGIKIFTLTLPSCLLPREDPSKSSSYSCSLLFPGDCSTKVCSSSSLD